MKFRNLTEKEIFCRIQSIDKAGLNLLLYKDARVDMEILDETVGAENWQCDYEEHRGILFCKLGININYKTENLNELPMWIWKTDAGSESNTEAEKGNASDAFKRAGFRWGIGRALYTSPEIRVWETDAAGQKNANIWHSDDGKTHKCYDDFSVERIKFSDDGKRIIGLAIRNDTLNKRVFVWQEEAQ